MPPLMIDSTVEPQDLSNSSTELNCDRFASCGEGDSAPVSSSHSRRTLRTRIRFSADSQVNTIINRDDYSQEELNACWYTADEKSAMYEGYEKTVMRMEQGKRPKKNTTYRGLENFSEANSAQLDEIVHSCIDAVMDEQDRQWQEDVFDWHTFRDMSLEVSAQSTSLAYKMAEYDEREARKAYIAMAKEEHERKVNDEASVGTEVTEVTNSTMAQDIKTKHHKMGGPILGRRMKSSKKDEKDGKKKKKSRPPKARSSGSRKSLGDALESLNKKVYSNEKMKDREFQPKALRVR